MDINDTKQMVRAVLETTLNKLSLSAFLHEYESVAFRKLPYQQFGYSDPETFLRSLDDTVTLTRQYGKEIMVGVIKSEKSAHIVELVHHSKKTGKHKRSSHSTPVKYHQPVVFRDTSATKMKPRQSLPHKFDSPRMLPANASPVYVPFVGLNQRSHGIVPYSQFGPNTTAFTRPPLLRPALNPVSASSLPQPPVQWTIPNSETFVKHQVSCNKPQVFEHIRHFLCANKQGVSYRQFLHQFTLAYRYEFIPELLGYSSLVDLLMSLSFVRMINTGSDIIVLFTEPRSQNVDCSAPSLQNSSLANVETEQISSSSVLDHDATDDSQSHSEEGSCHSRNESPFVSVTDNEDNNTLVANHAPKIKASDLIPNHMKAAFQQILLQLPNGVFLSDLTFEYEKLTKNQIHFSSYGFQSILELVAAIPETFKMIRCQDKNDWLLICPGATDKVTGSGRVRESEMNNNTSEERLKISGKVLPQVPKLDISAALKREILQVVCGCPFGLKLCDFEDHYKRFFLKDFQKSTNIAYSIEAVFLSLQDLDLVNVTYANKDITITILPEGRRLLSKPLLPPSVSAAGSVIPQDTADRRDIYVRQRLPESAEVGEYLQLRVVYIKTPSRYYIQLRGVNTSEALDSLMTDLNNFYSGYHAVRYILPSSHLEVGRPCVAVYPGDCHWYRAVISAIRDKSTVEVDYVDFGNATCISVKLVRLIKKDFMKLPAQALNARSYDFAPICGDYWSVEATKCFKKLVMDKHLVGYLVDASDDCLSLCLCDTNGVADIYIADALISQGYARTKSIPTVFKEMRLPATPCQLVSSLADLKDDATELPSGSASVDVPLDSANVATDCDPEAEFEILALPFLRRTRKINLVLMDDIYYVPSFEISKFLWPMDSLRQLLSNAGYKGQLRFVDRLLQPKLFSHLTQLRADRTTCSKAAIFAVDEVPTILKAIEMYHKNIDPVLEAFKHLADFLP